MTHLFTRLRQSRALLFLFLTALFTLLACVLRTLALFVSFDRNIGYFQSGSFLAIAARVCILLCALFCIALFFLINKEELPKESPALSTPCFISAAVTAGALCVAAFFLLFRISKIPAPAILVWITALCLLGSAVYFLLRLFNATPQKAAVPGFFTIFAAATVLATTYFDRYTQMNAPHKLALHLCMLAIMFAMLYELRILLDRPAPRAAAAVTAFAASLCTVYSLSNAIAFLGGVYHSALYFLFDLVALGFAAYFITKSVRLAISCNVKNTEVAQ